MSFAQASFSNIPVSLILLPETKSVAFVCHREFAPFYDDCTLPATYFDSNGMKFGEHWYEYQKTYACDKHPDMIKWLEQQQIILECVVSQVVGS